VNKTLSLSFVAVSFVALAMPAVAAPLAANAAPDALSVPGLSIDVAQDVDAAGAQGFVQRMADRGISFLGDQSIGPEQRKSEFRKLLRSSFDMGMIGRFAMGPYWRSLAPAQQAEYQKLFENMIVEVYARRFGDYNGQKLDVRNVRAENNTDAIVNSFIVPAGGGEEVQVDWRVRNKGGQYKVIDVVVAGVSMALTQRSEFSSVIQRGGGDASVLIDHLRSGAQQAKAE
jgi:phospholipid transport system substrate-binding protein